MMSFHVISVLGLPQSKILGGPMNWRSPEKNFSRPFFFFFRRALAPVSLVLGLEHSCPWPRESRSLSCKTHARAIAFFSYIWFKCDILSLHCCKLRCVVVIVLISVQPSHPGTIHTWVAIAWNRRIQSIDAVRRNGDGYAQSNLFFASKPCITVRVGAAMLA